MRALITGATGFVGSWLTRDLCQRGLDVRILCRRPEAAKEFEGLKNLEVFLGDVTAPESLVTATNKVDWVFHLAGVVAYSRMNRQLMEEVNVGGTANVIAACRAAKVKRLLHMSSVTAVGASFDGHCLNEESEYQLTHLDLGYFETKRAAESLVKEAVNEGKLDAVIVNPATIYGAGDALKGSRGTQIKVAKGKFPFYTSGGVNVIAVEDVIKALVDAMKKGRAGERYILSGENILVKDLFKMIAEEAGVKAPSIYLPDFVVHTVGQLGDFLEKMGKKAPLNSETAWIATLFHWFDSSKAQRELGLKPRPARMAIKNSLEWMRENGVI